MTKDETHFFSRSTNPAINTMILMIYTRVWNPNIENKFVFNLRLPFEAVKFTVFNSWLFPFPCFWTEINLKLCTSLTEFLHAHFHFSIKVFRLQASWLRQVSKKNRKRESSQNLNRNVIISYEDSVRQTLREKKQKLFESLNLRQGELTFFC